MMDVELSTFLPCAFDQAVEQVKKPSVLQYIARPFVRFVPVASKEFDEEWREGTHWAKLYLAMFVPFGKQAIVISYDHDSRHAFAVRDRGYSRLIKSWNHLVTIDPCEGGVMYRDHVQIEAGWLTPFVWLFAQLFYRHRQKRWRYLVANHFAVV